MAIWFFLDINIKAAAGSESEAGRKGACVTQCLFLDCIFLISDWHERSNPVMGLIVFLIVKILPWRHSLSSHGSHRAIDYPLWSRLNLPNTTLNLKEEEARSGLGSEFDWFRQSLSTIFFFLHFFNLRFSEGEDCLASVSVEKARPWAFITVCFPMTLKE